MYVVFIYFNFNISFFLSTKQKRTQQTFKTKTQNIFRQIFLYIEPILIKTIYHHNGLINYSMKNEQPK